MIKKSTLTEMLILVTAAVILLMALLSFNVNAQELASAANTATNTTANAPSNNATMKKQMFGPAGNRLSGNYTSPLAFSNNNTLTKAQILQQRGVPGEGIDNAPGLKKPFNPKAAENAGIKKFLYRFNHIFQEMIQKRFPLS